MLQGSVNKYAKLLGLIAGVPEGPCRMKLQLNVAKNLVFYQPETKVCAALRALVRFQADSGSRSRMSPYRRSAKN
jgi:hypothetical protein